MAGITDQKRRVTSEDDLKRSWGGLKNGSGFRCTMCGHRFQAGDGYRWVYSAGAGFTDKDGKRYGVINPMVCDGCDGEDVLDRWVKQNEEFMSPRFWALR